MPTRRSARELEVPRAELCTLLVEAAREAADFRFDDTIIGLDRDDQGVAVSFERAQPGRFDVVVGPTGSTPRSVGWPSDRKPTSSPVWGSTSLLCNCQLIADETTRSSCTTSRMLLSLSTLVLDGPVQRSYSGPPSGSTSGITTVSSS